MLEDMRLFATVVEQTSLNRAAERLNVTQPALSRRIARLEQELGVELFRRIGKRLELTAAGQLTYEFALELRRFHGEYLHRLDAFKSKDESPIATIGASLTTLQTTLPDLITSITEKHPHLEIKAITGKSHEIVTLVKEQKVDFGLVASAVEDPTVHSVPLFDDHLMLVLPRTHFILETPHLTISDLNRLPMILFAPGTWYRTLTDELFRRHGLRPDVRMEIDSFEAIVRLLSACRAGTLMPKSYLKTPLLAVNDLYVVHIPELEETKRTTSIVHGELSRLAASTRYLIEETIAFFTRGLNASKE